MLLGDDVMMLLCVWDFWLLAYTVMIPLGDQVRLLGY